MEIKQYLPNKDNIFVYACIILVVLLCISLKSCYDESKEKQYIQTTQISQQQLQDNITRSLSEYVTKQDLVELSNQSSINLDIIKKDLDKLDGKITGLQTVKVVSQGYQNYDTGSSYVTPVSTVQQPVVLCNGQEIKCPNIDKYNYLGTKQTLLFNERFSNIQLPIGNVSFSANREKPWDLEIKSREYRMDTVFSTLRDGRHVLYNKFMIDVDGNRYEIKDIQGKYSEEYPGDEFMWNNPKLYLGFNSGYGFNQDFSNSVGLHFSMLSYGKYYLSPDFNFLILGAGIDLNKKFVGMVTPANVNLNKLVNILHNVYVGPTIGMNTDKEVLLTLGLQVGL